MDFDVGGVESAAISYGDGVCYGVSNDGLDDLGADFGSSYDSFQPSYGGGNSPAKAEPNQNQVSYGGHAEYVKYEPYPQQNQNFQNNFVYQQQVIQPEMKSEPEPEPEPEVIPIEQTAEFQRYKPVLTISNVVSNFRCRCHLNLRQIALKSRNVMFRRDQNKVMMQLREPRMMANIWSSGKIVCQGARSEDDAKIGSRKFARIIQNCGFPNVRVSNYKVVNVLGNCKVNFAIDIMQFSAENAGPHCSYEPELHPAVTFKPGNGATVKIFSTGALTVLGRNVETVEKAVEMTYPLLFPFRRSRFAHDIDYKEDSDHEEY